MDEEGFRVYLKRQRRSEGTIASSIRFVMGFEKYLQEHRGGKGLDEAQPEDLEAFVVWGKRELGSVNSYLWGVSRYYEFTEKEEMRCLANEFRVREIEKQRAKRKPLRLKAIMGAVPEFVEKLAAEGISNVAQLLEAGRTREDREALAARTGVPLEHILELVKFADLVRISDIKGVRGRLLFTAGVDTIEKLASWDPKALQEKLAQENAESKILKRAPTLVETTFWVNQAKSLPKLVECK